MRRPQKPHNDVRTLLDLLGVRTIEEAVRAVQGAGSPTGSGRPQQARAPPIGSFDLTDPLRLVRPKELASLLGVHPITLWKWLRNGRLPKPVKIGHVTAWRACDLLAWLNQQQQAQTADNRALAGVAADR